MLVLGSSGSGAVIIDLHRVSLPIERRNGQGQLLYELRGIGGLGQGIFRMCLHVFGIYLVANLGSQINEQRIMALIDDVHALGKGGAGHQVLARIA